MYILVLFFFVLFLTKTIDKGEGRMRRQLYISVLSEHEFGGCVTVPSGNLFSSQTNSQYDTIYHDCHARLKRQQK